VIVAVRGLGASLGQECIAPRVLDRAAERDTREGVGASLGHANLACGGSARPGEAPLPPCRSRSAALYRRACRRLHIHVNVSCCR
jgi:hypothetical protein